MKRKMTKVNLNSDMGTPDYDPFVNLAEEVTTPDDRSFIKKSKINTKKYNKYASKNEKKYVEQESADAAKTRQSSQKPKAAN